SADAALGRLDQLRSLFDLDPHPPRAHSRSVGTMRLSFYTLTLASVLAATALTRLAFDLPGQAELAWCACGSALVLLLLVGVMKLRPWAADMAPPFVLFITLIGLANVLADVVLFGRPHATMFLPLLLVGAAALVLSWEWLTLISALSLGCWFVVVNGFCAEPSWLAYGGVQIGGLLLAGLLLYTRQGLMTDHEELLERFSDLELAAVESERMERELRTRLRLVEGQMRDAMLERQQRERQHRTLEHRLWETRDELRQQTEAASAARLEAERLAEEQRPLQAALAELDAARKELEALRLQLQEDSTVVTLQQELAAATAEADRLRDQLAEASTWQGLCEGLERDHAALAERFTAVEAERQRLAELLQASPPVDADAQAEAQQRCAVAERQLAAHQAEMQALLQGLPVGCLILQRDGRVLAENSKVQEWLGGRSFVDLVSFRQPPTKKTRGNPWAELWRRLERDGRFVWEQTQWPGDGDHAARPMRETYLRLPGEPDAEPLVAVLLEDLTPLKHVEAELERVRSETLQAQNELASRAAESSHRQSGTAGTGWSFNPHTGLWTWPSAWVSLQSGSARTQPLTEVETCVHPDDREALRTRLQGAEPWNLDLRLLTPLGKYEWHRLGAQRQGEGWQGHLTSIHDLRSAWAELQEGLHTLEKRAWPAQACLQYLGAEVRTFQTLQLQAADQLLSAPADGPERLRAVTQIRRLAEHLHWLNQNVLDLARLEAQPLELHPESVPLPRLLRSLLEEAQQRGRAKDALCELRCPGWLPRVLQRDPQRLRQLFGLLWRVALRQTESGTITWTWRLHEGPTPRLVATLEDRGCGFGPEELSQIFAEPLVAATDTWRRLGGIGIALRLASKLAQGLGGSLDVRSQPALGSAYEVVLPLAGEEMLDLIAGEEVIGPPPSLPSMDQIHGTQKLRGRVLLVEDNKDSQLVLGFHLDHLGVDVESCVDADDAVRLIHNRRFDVVILDGDLPGMAGLAVLRRLRAEHEQVPIVILTPQSRDGEEDRYLLAGGSELLTKPVELVDLFLTLARYLPVQESARGNGAVLPEPLRSPYQDDAEFRGLLREFVRSLPERTAELRSALQSAVWAGTIKLAHELRGAAAMYGYPPLADAIEQLEVAAVSGFDASRLRKLLREVEQQAYRCEQGLASRAA
ncbi:MAG TPA: response regulator, partial [Gemmatales bacterium]|nr:response regulator [Gemmatales bacterium]